MTNRRGVEIYEGTAMVVTDLHGAGDVYRRLRDRFLQWHASGRVQHFIICGDLIHSNGPAETDESLPILLDLMHMQADMGPDQVILLLGNHEMPHIYGQTLAKGDVEYTPRFEAALSLLDETPEIAYSRADVHQFLMEAPFYVFTTGGVMLAHAGPASRVRDAEVAANVLGFDHRALIEQADTELAQYDSAHARGVFAKLFGESYDTLVRHFLAVRGPDDPRYDHLLRSFILNEQHALFQLLWNVLFARNEYEFGDGTRVMRRYRQVLKDFFAAMAATVPACPPNVMVSGHIGVRGGHAVVDQRQLRLASYEHASPRDAGQFLLLDCAKPVNDAYDLLPDLHDTFA